MNNPEFKLVEFDQFRIESGSDASVFSLLKNGFHQLMPSGYDLNQGVTEVLLRIRISLLNSLRGYLLKLKYIYNKGLSATERR